MIKPTVILALLLAVSGLPLTQAQTSDSAPIDAPEPLYGSELMTTQERNKMRQKMRNASSQEERGQIREDHRKVMQERAKERGTTLKEPCPRGSGNDLRQSKGSGMGPGAGGRRRP